MPPLIVCCAPLSTKALTGCPFTSTGMLPRVSEGLSTQKGHCVLEHGYPPEAFRGIFDGVLQILQDSLLAYRLFDPPLCLDIKGISIKTRNLCLPTSLLIGSKCAQLSQELGKPPRIRRGGSCKLWLSLYSMQTREAECWKGERGQLSVTSCSERISSGFPRICNRIISASCSAVLGTRRSVMSLGITYHVKEAHLPATLIFLRSSSTALPDTPSPSMVAFTSLSSRPSYEMLCSLSGIPDLSRGREERDLSLGDTTSEATHFGLKQSHYVFKFHLRVDLDGE